MIQVHQGKTANEAWQDAANNLLNKELNLSQVGRGGRTLENLHSVFEISNPRQRWVVSRQPAINPAFAIAEVVWILNGKNEALFLNKWNSQLPLFAGSEEYYPGAYGFRLRQQFGIDQLDLAFNALKNNPNGRQIVLQIWDSRTDLPNEKGVPASPDIPCNIMSMLKIRDKKLEWTQIMRSNDLFKGTPYNFIQFTSLHEIFAGWLNVDVGSYCHWSDSLHVYLDDRKRGFSSINIRPKQNTDSLALSKEESEEVFKKLYMIIDNLSSKEISRKTLIEISNNNHFPEAYKNLIYLMAAESARRKKWLDLSKSIMENCTNPALIQCWERWFSRFHEN